MIKFVHNDETWFFDETEIEDYSFISNGHRYLVWIFQKLDLVVCGSFGKHAQFDLLSLDAFCAKWGIVNGAMRIPFVAEYVKSHTLTK